MLSPFSTRGTVGQPVRGGVATTRLWPLPPSGGSAVWPAALLIITAILPSARAGESAGEGWQFSVIPFLWMPGLSGEVGVRGVTAAVDASFIDILDTVKDEDSFIGLLGGSRPDTGPGVASSMGCGRSSAPTRFPPDRSRSRWRPNWPWWILGRCIAWGSGRLAVA